jgi:hypothetical protein
MKNSHSRCVIARCHLCELQIAALKPPTRNFAKKLNVFRDASKQQCKIKLGGAALRFTVIIDLLSLYVRHTQTLIYFSKDMHTRETPKCKSHSARVPTQCCGRNSFSRARRPLGELLFFII